MMAAAVAERVRNQSKEYLIVRMPDSALDGKWSFPFGEIDKGDAPEAAARRLARKLLNIGMDVQIGQPPFDAELNGTLYRWRFCFGSATGGEAEPVGVDELRWVIPGTLVEYEFDPVSQQVVDWLRQEDAASSDG